MNKQRRKQIADLATAIEKVMADAGLEDHASDVEGIRDEEQEYFDNMPESLQGGERGQAAEAAVGYLEEAIEKLREAQEALEEALSNLREAEGV